MIWKMATGAVPRGLKQASSNPSPSTGCSMRISSSSLFMEFSVAKAKPPWNFSNYISIFIEYNNIKINNH